MTKKTRCASKNRIFKLLSTIGRPLSIMQICKMTKMSYIKVQNSLTDLEKENVVFSLKGTNKYFWSACR